MRIPCLYSIVDICRLWFIFPLKLTSMGNYPKFLTTSTQKTEPQKDFSDKPTLSELKVLSEESEGQKSIWGLGLSGIALA